MSFINFESGRVNEQLRNEKRKAREAVLEKAEADYKRRKEREQRAAERGEDKWMLPSLDAQLQPDSNKKNKKHKKEKKKKEKKHKHKKKHDSSDSSDDSDAGEWVEKGKDSMSEPPAPTQRDEWMTLPALFPCVSRDQIRAQKRQEAPVDEEAMKKKFLLDNPGQSDRELNPFWKDGGKGLPQVEEPAPDSLSLPANTAGDHGLAWLRRALRRVQEQAKEEGRSEEAVASERWGSLEKLKSMLSEAEHRCRSRPRYGDRGRSRRGGRVQGPAPKPREYEDWREDPTAGESTAAQSEVVGDKSRYRSWLGIKDPSPPKEPSSDDDDFDYNQLDDPPTVEGLILKEKTEKENEKNITEKKDCSDNEDDDEETTDGKILFRSSKARKSNISVGKLRTQVHDRLNPLGRKVPVKTIGGEENELDSDDDDKLFQEWRNEKMERGSEESDNDESNENKQKSSTETKKDVEKQQIDKQGSGDDIVSAGNSKDVYPTSSDELRERLFQARKKDRIGMNIEDEGVQQSKSEREYRKTQKHSSEHDQRKGGLMKKDQSPANLQEKGRDRDEELKVKRENWNERERSGKYRYRDQERGDDDDDDNRKRRERDRERMELSLRDKRRDGEDNKDRTDSTERSKSKNECRREVYDDERTRRISEYKQSNRERERMRYEEDSAFRKRDVDDDSKCRDRTQHKSSRDSQSGPRRTDIPDYLRKHRTSTQYERVPPRRLGFRKPEDDSSNSSKYLRPDILGDAKTFHGSSTSAKNWMKREFRKPEEKLVQKDRSPPPKSIPKPLPTVQTIETREKEEEKPVDVQMSDAEMNALGAKVLKAELLGNRDLAARLKKQLEQAQASRQRAKVSPVAGGAISKSQDEETVLLTRRDAKGFVRPVEAPSHPEPSGGRRRPQRVATHGADGLRDRFFPDDDKYSLENMFQKEKMTTMEESNEEFCRLASKGAGRTESEYDLDDIFTEKITREKAPGKLQALERNRAIREHKRVERSLDSCTLCFDSPKMMKHLMIALGSKVYLSLPAHQSLVEGHCLLSPIHHVPCATQLDEDVWEEMTSFRKALVSMFSKQDQDCVFFESAMHLRRFPHMVLECVPLPQEEGDTAPIYFKKAIMESEAEWSMNKKLVDLKGKGVRRAVPKGLPYFAVDFGNDDGFAHVIEDEKLFPENFAQEIIGGMMDLDHSLWRKKRHENFDTQRKKVLQFAELWKEYDITKKVMGDSSTSSSESDME